MKKRVLSLLLAAVMLLTVLPVLGITANAEASNITVSGATYYSSGALKSLDTKFNWNTASAPSRLALMTKQLANGDLTNTGNYGTKFDIFEDVLAHDQANGTFGIITSSSETTLSNGTNTLSISFDEGAIPLNVDKTYYVYLWTDWAQYGTQYYYPDYLIAVIKVQNGVVQYTGATGNNSYNEGAFQFVKAKEVYDVTITAPNTMATSGSATQNDLEVPMTPVVYTTAAGYHFPADYAVASVNGIKVTRDSETQITVSGMPTADTAITLTAPSANRKVTVTPAANMTKTAESGAAEQSVPGTAMTDAVYTANEGFYFPENYTVAAVNGISVTRNSESQITVSGTPTADAAIALVAPTRKQVALEEATFGYAYDVQRSPAYPTKGQSITLSGLKKPYLSENTQHSTNEGTWTLTNLGAYFNLKDTDKDTAGLKTAVSGAANAYNVSPNGIVVHELKNNGQHVAYGVVVMYDIEKGLAAYICDTLNRGAGWLLSLDPQSGSVTGTSTLNTTDWIVKRNITVTTTDNGTTSVSATTAVAGDTITVTATPDDTYTVSSVKYNDGTDHEVTAVNGVYSFAMPDKDVTVTVTYAKKTYTVTYKADGETVGEQTVEHGKDATAPTVPAKTGHTGAWESEGKNITADTTINAVYTANIYTVTYKADGETVQESQVEYGKNASAPAVPAKTGYTGIWEADGKNITANTTINAVYTINKYNVTYKADGVTVGEVQKVEHGKDATAPAVPAKTGYTGAWETDGKNITADTTINAVYTINKYTVTYVADGSTVRIVEVAYGQDAAAPEVPAKDGYTAAWDHDGKNITADTTINAVYTLIPVSKVPQTGDETPILLWVILALFGMSGTAYTVVKTKE